MKTKPRSNPRQFSSLRSLAGRHIDIIGIEFNGPSGAMILRARDLNTGECSAVDVPAAERTTMLTASVARDGRYRDGIVFDPAHF